jgi:hypothetical protein
LRVAGTKAGVLSLLLLLFIRCFFLLFYIEKLSHGFSSVYTVERVGSLNLPMESEKYVKGRGSVTIWPLPPKPSAEERE